MTTIEDATKTARNGGSAVAPPEEPTFTLWTMQELEEHCKQLDAEKARETDRLYAIYRERCERSGSKADKLVARYGTWLVTSYGVEHALSNYNIRKERVNEPRWVRHMAEKNWVADLGDFALALEFAREHFKHLKVS